MLIHIHQLCQDRPFTNYSVAIIVSSWWTIYFVPWFIRSSTWQYGAQQQWNYSIFVQTLDKNCTVRKTGTVTLKFVKNEKPERNLDLIALAGLEKSGRIVAFCDWNARFCDQKTWCSRNFAPKTWRPGASLRPNEHSSRPDSKKQKSETAFVSNLDERERRESRQFSCLCLQLGVDRKLWTCAAICRLRRVAPGHLRYRLALPDPSIAIGRRSYLQSDIGKALFLTLKKALEQGMIGNDKDFSGKVCVKWKDTEFERQVEVLVRSESLIPRGDAIHAQAHSQQP